MHNGVFGIGGNEFILNRKNIFAIFARLKLIRIDGDRRLARIVNVVFRMFICRRKPGRSYRIGEICHHKIIDLCADVYSVAQAVNIIVIYGQFVGIDRCENGNGVEALIYGISDFNFVPVFLVLPVIEHFALDKRIIGQSRNLSAHSYINKVLRFFADDMSFIVFNKERNSYLVRKIRIQGKILIDRG